MFCSQCGEQAVQNARFCAKCGAELLTLAPPSTYSEAAPVVESSPSNQVRPWVRYWARMFDIYMFSLIGGVILGVIAPRFIAQKNNEYLLGMILVFAWIFVESLLLSSFGTTPGKWLFKIRLALASGEPINYSNALTRSLKVWWRGFGIGFPIAALITTIVAHGRLKRNGITSWDSDGGFSVTHETIGVPRILAAIGFFALFLVVIAIGSSDA